MSAFINDTFDFGEVNLKDTDTITWEFFFKEPCFDYHYTDTYCICTQLTEKDLLKKLKGTLALGLAGVPSTPGKHVVDKQLTVYYDPSIQERVSSPQGARVFNPNKKTESLFIRGTVIVS